MIRRKIFISWFLLLLLTACAPFPVTQPIGVTQPAATSSHLPTLPPQPLPSTSTPSPTVVIGPTRTPIQLPLELPTASVEQIDCGGLYVLELPVSELQGKDESDVVIKMAEIYLQRYTNPLLTAGCKVDGYRVDEIHTLTPAQAAPLSPKGDFLRGIRFSVKLIQLKSLWITYSGEIDQENWLHTGRVFAFSRIVNASGQDVYRMEMAFP